MSSNPHFLLISCKSESNFTLKTTASLLTAAVLPPLSSQNYAKLNFPNASDPKAILDSALYWTHIDFNEESKKDIEALLVRDDIVELTRRFRKRLEIKDGVVSGKLGGGFSRVNFLTL